MTVTGRLINRQASEPGRRRKPRSGEHGAGQLDFPFGYSGPRDLELSDQLNQRGPGSNHFGLIARTELNLPKGRWRFQTMSDDGVRVMVNSKPVIENWTWHVPTKNEGVFVQADESIVPVVVEYFEIDGFVTLQLEIELAGK